MNCPACSATRSTPHAVAGVRVCRSCGAHFTERPIYRGDSYSIVLPYWHDGDECPDQVRYFDMDVLGSAGLERRHGWFHMGTRRITQTG